MPVVLYLTSDEERKVEGADAARLDGGFFVVAKRRPGTGALETVLTLWAPDVIAADVTENGVTVNRVLGLGKRPDPGGKI
ncbi:MAG: hypothetical protein ACRD3G_25630 [Vicinamibacterales bacterium]